MGICQDIVIVAEYIQNELSEDYKKDKVKWLRDKYDIIESFRSVYEKTTKEISKTKGVVYTPVEIVDYMIANFVENFDYQSIWDTRICDPSCGTGNFLLALINKFYEKIMNEDFDLKIKNQYIDELFDKIIWGYDIDITAVAAMQLHVYEKYGRTIKNLYNFDFLYSKERRFDFIVGNPPYIGHKNIDKDYREDISRKFNSVYSNKGDLSYCFIYKAMNSIKNGGKVSMITSRYFIESLSGEKLRKEILDFTGNLKIVDFYGIRPFKGVGVDPLIFTYERERTSEELKIEVIKPKMNKGVAQKSFLSDIIEDENKYQKFEVNPLRLSEKKWRLIEEKAWNIVDKIHAKSSKKLENLVLFNQGIITGCDKAFIIKKDDKHDVNPMYLKKWIKSSNIRSGGVSESDKMIIYTNSIDEKKEESISTLNHIGKYMDKLIRRRECIKGIRKWYELQWGRSEEIFEDEKIIFPYKAERNRFALDKGSYFSADIYCMRRKENFKLKRLEILLNSSIYEFYMKVTCKKLGNELYEYYPNSLKEIMILDLFNEDSQIDDDRIYEYLNIDLEEKKIIENMICRG